jgi:nodulation protein E
MIPRRVAVTGIGVVSAFGDDFGAFWTGVASGSSAIRAMSLVPPGSLRFPNAAEAAHFDAARHFEPKQIDYLDRFAQFAIVAAREAVRTSCLKIEGVPASRTAIVTGSSAGGQATKDEGFHSLYAMNGRVSPLTIPRVSGNAARARRSSMVRRSARVSLR